MGRDGDNTVVAAYCLCPFHNEVLAVVGEDAALVVEVNAGRGREKEASCVSHFGTATPTLLGIFHLYHYNVHNLVHASVVEDQSPQTGQEMVFVSFVSRYLTGGRVDRIRISSGLRFVLMIGQSLRLLIASYATDDG